MVLSYKTLKDIADAVIGELNNIKDPFITPTVVCHNTKVVQWFKAYYLKSKKDVMMNVKFKPLSVFVNDLLNPDEKYKVIGKQELSAYITKVLLNPTYYSYNPSDPKDPINYIFLPDGSINGINLHEFSDKLAGLFIDYECDCTSVTSGWQYDLYRKVSALAESDGCYTSKGLYDKFGITGVVPENVYVINNSFVTKLFEDILSKCSGIKIYYLESLPLDKSKCDKKLISAPSMLREVEAIHSEICKILKNEKGVKYNDFLVYAPDINAYINTVNRVFLQDNKTYPSIPIRFVGALKEHKDMVDSLSLLFDIATKRFFTRNDFYKFVSNPMIKWIRGISEDDIKIWMDAIINTNTHRNGKENDIWNDDWDYFRKRLVLTKVVADSADAENTISLNDKTYLPYYSMDLDDDKMVKLVDIIDALIAWKNVFASELNTITVDEGKRKEILAALDSLYSFLNKDGVEKNYLYRSVKDTVADIDKMKMDLPANTFMLTLIDAPDRYFVNPADMFVGGVTCCSLNCDDIVPAKYTFVMGLSSKDFPRIDVVSELDLFRAHKTSKELDTMSLQNICGGAEQVVFSYVNCDLQKDAPQFPSTLIPKGLTPIEITIDETRDYDEIFTQKEMKYKDDFYDIGDESLPVNASFTPTVAKASSEEPIVKLSEFKKFIKNTFIYRFEKHLKTFDDDEKDILDEYEVIDVSALNRTMLIKEMSTLRSANRGKTMYKASQKLAGNKLGEAYYDLYDSWALAYRDEISTGYEKSKLKDLVLTDGSGSNWTLVCNYEIFKKEDGNKITYLEPQYAKTLEQKEDKLKYFLNMYAFSLMDIASKKDDIEYVVNLWNPVPDSIKSYNMSSGTATQILMKFYSFISRPECIKYMDFAFLEELHKKFVECGRDPSDPKFIKVLPKSIESLIGTIQRYHDWEYFKDRNMPDVYVEFGYTEKGFVKEFIDNLFDIWKLVEVIL